MKATFNILKHKVTIKPLPKKTPILEQLHKGYFEKYYEEEDQRMLNLMLDKGWTEGN